MGVTAMTALFKEFESYKKQVEQSESLRRLCYVIVMLLSDGAYFHFYEEDIFDEKRAEDFSEENFYLQHYDRLVKIFPLAESMFKKEKFLDE
jgi:hypothetical protein